MKIVDEKTNLVGKVVNCYGDRILIYKASVRGSYRSQLKAILLGGNSTCEYKMPEKDLIEMCQGKDYYSLWEYLEILKEKREKSLKVAAEIFSRNFVTMSSAT